MNNSIIAKVDAYYSEKIRTFGPVAKGVDWNGQESQNLRFQQILKVVEPKRCNFSLNDLGCGYGALLEYVIAEQIDCRYTGYDISLEMIASARNLWKNRKTKEEIRFIHGDLNDCADFTVASGIFNVRQDITDSEWLEYIITVINKIDQFSACGFAFNMLTKYSDQEYMRNHLYYADPFFFFDYCKRNHSKKVALLHDYDLYEFTIIVRKG